MGFSSTYFDSTHQKSVELMDYFLCYDISDNKLRRRVAKYLEKAGLHRVQKSIFFAKAYQPKQIQHIANKIASIAQEDEYYADSILLIPIEKDQLNKVVVYGENREFRHFSKEHFSKFF